MYCSHNTAGNNGLAQSTLVQNGEASCPWKFGNEGEGGPMNGFELNYLQTLPLIRSFCTYCLLA